MANLKLERIFEHATAASCASGGWALAALFLEGLSRIYGACTWLRTACYDIRLLRRVRARCPVISVGNISLGGTGKTPMVKWLAEHLVRKGHSVLVLSRGYGRIARGASAIPAGEPGRKETKAADDEAFGIDITGCITGRGADVEVPPAGGIFRVVGANRARQGEAALNWLGSRAKGLVAILDDGFQHLRLERDLDVVMVSCLEPRLTGARLFPAGPFREMPVALRRAHVVVLAHTDVSDEATVQKTERVVRNYAPDAIVVRSRHRPSRVRVVAPPAAAAEGTHNIPHEKCREASTLALQEDAGLSRTQLPDSLAGMRLFAFCGIGNPQQFVASLRRLGADIVGTTVFPDHHAFTPTDLAKLESAATSKCAQALVTTEKDFRRLGGHSFSLPLHIVEIELEVVDPGYRLEKAIDEVACRGAWEF